MNIHRFLPSKQFLVTLAVLVGVGIIATVFGYFFSDKSTYTKKATDKADVIITRELVEKDTDGDGLKDWEESLWGTNPNVKDTNGDGISDFDEVNSKRAKLAETTGAGNTASIAPSPNTKTEQFAEETLTLVSALNASGDLTEENKRAISDNIVAYIQNGEGSKKYTIANLKTVSDTPQNRKAYYASLSNAFQVSSINPDDFKIISEYQDHIDAGDFSAYVQVEKKYEKLISALGTMNVPEASAFDHIQVLNRLEAMKDIFAHLSLYETDPIKSLSASVQFDAVASYFQEISTYINNIKSSNSK